MATNTTGSSTIAYLNFVTRELNRYIPIPALILGTIGNILNIMIFTRPLLRTNPCSLYFISGSVANFFSLYIGLITPFLGLYNFDPTQKSSILCRIRFYLRFITITLSTWFVLFACVDRFLSTSIYVHFRSWSSLRLAKRIIIFATMICFIVPYTQVFFCYSISERNVCVISNNICRLSLENTLLLCNSGIPPILMILISILTIYNVKQSNQLNTHRRKNMELIRILLIQVIVLVLFSVPITAQKIYSCSTLFMKKSELTTAIGNLTSQISTEISYINNSITFYVYSLTSKKFRKEVSYSVSALMACQCNKTNIVQPVTGKSKSNPSEIVVKNDV